MFLKALPLLLFILASSAWGQERSCNDFLLVAESDFQKQTLVEGPFKLVKQEPGSNKADGENLSHFHDFLSGGGDGLIFKHLESQEVLLLVKKFPDLLPKTSNLPFYHDQMLFDGLKNFLASGHPIIFGLPGLFIGHGTGSIVFFTEGKIPFELQKLMPGRIQFERLLGVTPFFARNALVHELVHWNDFASGVVKDVNDTLSQLVENKKISANQKARLFEYILEQRAYTGETNFLVKHAHSSSMIPYRKTNEDTLRWGTMGHFTTHRLQTMTIQKYGYFAVHILKKIQEEDPETFAKVIELIKRWEVPSEFEGLTFDGYWNDPHRYSIE